MSSESHNESTPQRRSYLANPFVIAGTVVLIGALVVCAFWLRQHRDELGYHTCGNNLHNLAMALALYHDTHQQYPPAYIADAEGRPMHSWRVLILPLFGDPALDAAYKKYDFGQAWNSPNNLEVAKQIDQLENNPFRCPRDSGEGTTSFVAVTGPETMWDREPPGRLPPRAACAT